MSLLIKALQKAEDDKKTDDKNKTSASALTLEPNTKASDNSLDFAPSPVATPAPTAPVNAATSNTTASSTEQKSSHQQSTSNLFEAKNTTTKKNTKPVLLGGIALGLVCIGVGGFYYYLESLNPTQMAIASPNVQVASNTPPQAMPADANANMPSATENTSNASEPASPEPQATQPTSEPTPEEDSTKKMAVESAPPATLEAQSLPAKVSALSAKPSKRYAFGDEPQPLTESNSLKITRKQSDNGINPNLIGAYNAFNTGDDATAQQLYRNVLQVDTRNTDALLGMATISSRQGRLNDANGWYSKVLEVEPRNTYALAAMSDLANQTDPVSAESRIKNMLAQQPQAPQLHAALGQLYLDQGNWALAQQAFFEAHHFAPNQADYAYNLAICLDQMGKGQLALPYYKKALMLAKAGPSSIDGNALESRIQALQTE